MTTFIHINFQVQILHGIVLNTNLKLSLHVYAVIIPEVFQNTTL